eukprot:m.52305 g.52305  ORF g.52305 m.52305 type:complete len:756 (-) comp11293_c0_seq4:148-2415(-)
MAQWAMLLVLVLGLLFGPSTSTPMLSEKVGGYQVNVEDDGLGQVSLTSGAATVWSSTLTPVSVYLLAASFEGHDGMFKVKEDPNCVLVASPFVAKTVQTSETGGVIVSGPLVPVIGCTANSLGSSYQIRFELDEEMGSDMVSIVVSAVNTKAANYTCQPLTSGTEPSACLVRMHVASDPSDAVFGFGTQYSVLDMKGRRVPILVTEQGVGRGLEPLTELLNIFSNGEGGNWHTTYGPIPHYITSSMQSLFLNQTDYAVFDLTNPKEITVSVLAPTITAFAVNGTTPAEHVQRYTLFAGRMQPLPDWILSGPIVGYYGGTNAVLAMQKRLLAAGINATGFWLQDWTGLRNTTFGERLWWNWQVDPAHYPQWDQMCSSLLEQGTRVLTYVNPYLANTYPAPPGSKNLFQQAADQGYLVKDSTGNPYIDFSADPEFTFGTIDLSNPDANKWFRDVILRGNMLSHQHAGWMSDFGEYLPFDANLSNGNAPSFHNAFPQEWARLNRESVESTEAVFFSRSSFSKSPKYSTLFWLGDQLVTWDAFDGLATVLMGRISSGLSGLSLSHSDTGGYTMIKKFGLEYLRSKELLVRWMEMTAVLDVIYRTHQGNLPEDSWQVYTDDSTLSCFKRSIALHKLFVPYRKVLMAKAASSGEPLVRSMWYNYPEIESLQSIFTQGMVGTDFLFAPVLQPNTTTVSVTFPTGEWHSVWDSSHVVTVTAASKTITVEAPIGMPAIFYVDGSSFGKAIEASIPTVTNIPCAL